MQDNDDDVDIERWNKIIEEEFDESIGQINISGNDESDNLGLMGVFIARTRWDLTVKDMDSRVGIRSGRPTFPRPNRPGFLGLGRSRTWGSRFQPRSRSISV